MPGLPSPSALRVEALTERVRPRDVRRDRRARGEAARAADLLRFVLVPLIGVLACVVGAAALAFGVSEELASSAPDRVSESVVMAGIAVGMLVAGALLAVFVVRGRSHRLPALAQSRLLRFAERNGLAYEPGPDAPALLAVLERRGAVVVRAVVRSAGPPETEVGAVELRVGEDRARQTRLAGYCAVRMPRPGPDLVVRSERASGHPLTVDSPPDPAARMHLPGAADQGVTVSCPAGYRDDAWFLLTSEVVGALADPRGAWDLEVVDDVLVLSRPEAAVTLDAEQWRRIAALVAVLQHRLEQWARWREDRAGAPPLPERPATASPYSPAPLPQRDAVPGARLQPTRGRPMLTAFLLSGGILVFVLLARLLDR